MTRCVMFRLKDLDIVERKDALNVLPDGKLLINTINAHSYNVARKDPLFAEALTHGDVLIPDGMSIVKACKWIRAKSRPQERIAGWDLFEWEMSRLNEASRKEIEGKKGLPSRQGRKKKVMFMGSSEETLALDVKECNQQYPYLEVVTYSPPYKQVFSEEDDRAIIQAINDADPDLLWIGMTAPKQEKWTYAHWKELEPGFWRFEITANRFLRNMVRAIVGTLLLVGRGKLNPADVAHIIAQRNRNMAGESVPACGLSLVDVVYENVNYKASIEVGMKASDGKEKAE